MSNKNQRDLEKENLHLREQLAKVSFERDKYKKLFEVSGDALSIIDLSSGKFIQCNDSAIKMHGVESKNNFLNLSPSDISPPIQPCGKSSEELATRYVEKAHSDGPQLFQWTHSKIDGTEFPCLVSLSAVQIQNKNLILAIGRDISDLMEVKDQLEAAHTNIKHYKAAYQKEKIKFESFVNLAPVGIAVNSLKDGAFHYVNNEFSHITGYTVDEINAIDYWQITPDKYKEQEEKQLLSLVETGRYGPYEKEYINKSGVTFPVRLSGIKVMDENGDDLIWSVVQDTSEQKNTEQQLLNAIEKADLLALRIQLANTSAQIGVWEWDLITGKLFWDELMLTLYGLKKEQFKESYDDWVKAVHPDDIELANAQLKDSIEKGALYEPEFRVVHPDGKIRTLKASARVIRDKWGTPLKVIGVSYDVTDKIQAIETSENARVAAENASKIKSDFLANMSHEIRTPMNAILGGLQLLDNAELSTDLRKILVNATSSAKSLLTIINDILDYSKVESNKIEIEKMPLSIVDILNSVKYDLDALISNQQIDFKIDVSKNFHDNWLGDQVRVKQIILNLASNAVKFTNQGCVKIAVDCIEHKSQETILIKVEDSGIGMSEEAQGRIFERFSQADTSTTREYGGTGLGMSITISLVKLMGGEIAVNSIKGRGTIIDVTLPLEKTHVAPKKVKAQSCTPPALSGKRILIAEDNKINQMLIKTMLQETESSLVIVENGMLAVDAFKNQPFDLVLMDIHMPVMDGVEALKSIKTLNNSIPIIALTANVMVEDVRQYLKLGFDAHVPKPIELSRLYGTLLEYE
ncbi:MULTISPECIES: PAS domain-containing hybrid sensor histidine kinase/response regulator [unclassified Pseudoalteromonas]|uniref:PAS domain-containing hybrid sensor histidine kinase/response regulator n=1 Tax=unclassified Pseudoalteromonas TaxID=194690 RepID=UPI001F2AD47C|nr:MULTISPECIES: PAS domain-containing hybrid sensor histidine kinase/response regulator [unclassified Pseudoalteromonas]MDP2633193.1 PAS domain S-box protein [Pseudoalteromonas sp. 1_MG-2023]